jgi:hypothetical protein
MSAESKAAGARLKVETRYLPGEDFRKIFEADSAKNAEIIARAGLTASK